MPANYLLPTLCIIGILNALLYTIDYRPFSPSNPSSRSHTGYFEYECAGKPHQSSWESWFHPQRVLHPFEAHKGSPGAAGEMRQGEGKWRGQGGGAITKDWNILYHLGGNGPWVEKVEGVVEGGVGVPGGCVVEQVHMMARHAERYPTTRIGVRMIKLLERIKQSGMDLKGDLDFVNDWEFFSSDPKRDFEQLTTTGPFSGSLGAFTTGVRLRTRYHHLLPQRLPQGKINFWASDSPRVIDTAQYFGTGFFGVNWNNTATLHVIPETFERGGDSLTPGDTCLAYLEDEEEGHDKGHKMLAKFRNIYLEPVRRRLLEQNPEMGFTYDEIYAMQEMCGFEITIRGSSPWCDVFSQDEWRGFEYARDLLHFYRAGPGTKYAGVMGWLWLNATMNLLVEGPVAGPFFFSFVHDGDIAPMLTALDIINDPEPLPVTGTVPPNRKWRKSQVSPMGARIIFERLSCRNESFVRININDGIIAIADCDRGPGRSCSLQAFKKKVEDRGRELGDFREVCGLGRDTPDRITFLHQ